MQYYVQSDIKMKVKNIYIEWVNDFIYAFLDPELYVPRIVQLDGVES